MSAGMFVPGAARDTTISFVVRLLGKARGFHCLCPSSIFLWVATSSRFRLTDGGGVFLRCRSDLFSPTFITAMMGSSSFYLVPACVVLASEWDGVRWSLGSHLSIMDGEREAGRQWEWGMGNGELGMGNGEWGTAEIVLDLVAKVVGSRRRQMPEVLGTRERALGQT